MNGDSALAIISNQPVLRRELMGGCAPEWLATKCRETDGICDPQHHLIVNLDVFDKSKLRQWFESLVAKVEAPDWAGVGEDLSRFGY